MKPQVLRIALFGPECSGKSTLARKLAEHFNEPWAAEYVREFFDAHDGDIQARDLSAIARGQIANEEMAVNRARRLCFCDTELITNTLWADLLFPGQCPAWIREAAEQRSRHYAIYLFCENDIDFVDDGQRCFLDEAGRRRGRDLWHAALTDRKLTFVEISGSLDERLARAIQSLECLLQS